MYNAHVFCPYTYTEPCAVGTSGRRGIYTHIQLSYTVFMHISLIKAVSLTSQTSNVGASLAGSLDMYIHFSVYVYLCWCFSSQLATPASTQCTDSTMTRAQTLLQDELTRANTMWDIIHVCSAKSGVQRVENTCTLYISVWTLIFQCMLCCIWN